MGAADPKGYATWNASAELDADTEDVGYRAEPSIDAIMGLDPDLVVLEKDGGDALVRQMEKAGCRSWSPRDPTRRATSTGCARTSR